MPEVKSFNFPSLTIIIYETADGSIHPRYKVVGSKTSHCLVSSGATHVSINMPFNPLVDNKIVVVGLNHHFCWY